MVEAVIPKLDETTQVATVERWLVREGERVEQGQAICEVETDNPEQIDAVSLSLSLGIT